MDVLGFVARQKWVHSEIPLDLFTLHTFKLEFRAGKTQEAFDEIVKIARMIDKWCVENFGDMQKLDKDQMQNGHVCVVNLVHYAVSNVKIDEDKHILTDTNNMFELSIIMGDVNATQFKLMIDAAKGS